MRTTFKQIFALMFLFILSAVPLGQALAQEDVPTPPALFLSTQYPAQVIGVDEAITLKLELEAEGEPQIVRLSMDKLPDGWTATFRGGGRIIESVYVKPGTTARVDLKLENNGDLPADTYDFVVVARSDAASAKLPIQLTTEEKLPPSLTLTADLPTLKGSPNTTFRYNLTLKNEGDEEITVNLQGEAPDIFLLTFKLTGQEVTSFPIGGGESKRITVEAKPLVDAEAGTYPIRVEATSEALQASIDLEAEVAGQARLSVAGLDGRLSGQANAGKATSIKLLVRNPGSAEARGITFSSTEPNGWEVSFDPEEIVSLPAGEYAEVTMNITPPKDAVAGDYIVTVRARSADKANTSADFRITVTTSTLWGVVGIALIAIAVAVVMLAVARFGRR